MRIPDSEIIGKKFNRLTPIKASEQKRNHRYFLCECECGNRTDVRLSSLLNGAVRSCGCLKNKHGEHGSPEYKTWKSMKGRCFGKSNPAFRWYGARGITVCEEWKNSFAAFYRDMGKRPSLRHSLDRIDNDGDYKPENCRWATDEEQGANTSRTRLIEFNGKKLSINAWARETGIDRRRLWERIAKQNWPIEKALTIPPGLRTTRLSTRITPEIYQKAKYLAARDRITMEELIEIGIELYAEHTPSQPPLPLKEAA